MPGCTNSQIKIVGSTGLVPMDYPTSSFVQDIGPGRSSYSSSSVNASLVWTKTGIHNLNISGVIYYGNSSSI